MQQQLKFTKHIILVVVLACLAGCKPDEFTMNGNDKLSISTDTILFDTILSQKYTGTPKSVNRQFIVRNPHNKKVKTTINLALGSKSAFRLNVDGDPGINFDNIEIRANDSIYVFVEAYAQPNFDPAGNPVILRDSIVFNTNGNRQDVKLVAWGQDAYYYYMDSTSTDVVWADKTRPYVVYDYFYVKPGATLTIKPGVNVLLAPYSRIFTEGTLKVEGTLAEPVIFEGDRTSDKHSDRYSAFKYANIPGQWLGLQFYWPSANNVIKHARIKNGTIGVIVDSVPVVKSQPTVSIYNTYINNMSLFAIRGKTSKIYAENTVMANCGSACVYTYQGGDYDLRHVTLIGGKSDPALVVTNILRDNLNRILGTYPITFTLLNSIVWGNLSSAEIGLDIDETKVIPPFAFQNSVLKTNDPGFMAPALKNVFIDPKFKNYKSSRFDLDTLSPARNIGLILNPPILMDYFDKIREPLPDAGAYERFD